MKHRAVRHDSPCLTLSSWRARRRTRRWRWNSSSRSVRLIKQRKQQHLQLPQPRQLKRHPQSLKLFRKRTANQKCAPRPAARNPNPSTCHARTPSTNPMHRPVPSEGVAIRVAAPCCPLADHRSALHSRPCEKSAEADSRRALSLTTRMRASIDSCPFLRAPTNPTLSSKSSSRADLSATTAAPKMVWAPSSTRVDTRTMTFSTRRTGTRSCCKHLRTTHNPEAKKLNLCNTCYGLCSCGKELEEGVCDNCGSLAPLTCNQPRTAPEFPKPVFKEDIKGRRQQQLSKHSHLDRIERIARASVTSSGEEDDDETQSKYRRRSRLSSGSEIGSDTDEVSGVPSLSSSPVPTSPPLADQPLATPAAQTARSLPGTGDDASDSDDDQPPLRRRKIKFGDDLVMGEYDRYRYLNVFVDECLFTFVNPETGERGIAVEGSNPPIILPILESDTYFDFFQREANGDLFAISRRCISDVAEDLVRSASPVVGDGSGSATSPPSSGPSTPKLSQVVFPSNNSPKNISRVYLVDKVNHNLLYFADKKLGEYFAWKTDSGDVFQVS
ncbi:hypothetical protein, variant 3 [Capsaspora owczarzaki ATCC 30864]|uniref:Uncharacterized protein n=1 Tax=Capsaspora owczarzaki (strain ATCC 30864) TaxID=595528 RepID=A0A0D2X3U9_CAPO3|nr:hypothetical protein CAOG_005477 [Capsaspora owczarzaki ATCC 30864]KJE94939.1 hypothetical protein, variant 1 [Capsaspora owczarzaki ATCC 30864]KJE94940.1 hypothetical protein, variant 2 [Capsaspora owczarzaki ATCC 30864]KJE94941.1 hypothetical protein, variant 3 [Capsaspora owczarzaki ATCC 30864]